MSSPTSAQAQKCQTQWFDTTHVIAIGIDNYQNGVPPLGKAVNDAIAVAGIIKDLNSTEPVEYYFLLAPSQDNASAIKQIENFGSKNYGSSKDDFCNLLNNILAEKVKPNDRIILYFAGHGIAQPFNRLSQGDDNRTGDKLKIKFDDKPQGHLLFQDAKKDDRGTYIKMDELIESLNNIKCRHGLIVLDSCFAGAIEWSLLRCATRQMLDDVVTPSILDRYITKNAWQILTSSSENQKTNEFLSINEQLQKSDRGSGDNSPFVVAFRKTIDSAADLAQPPRGFIRATQLFDLLREKIVIDSHEANKLQTPCLFTIPLKHEQTAEFVFLLGGQTLDKIIDKLPPDPEIKNPYRGLESYLPENSDIFFGREQLIKELFELVESQNKKEFSLTVVSGSSGSGKSSLVNAGLIPRMFKDEIEGYKQDPAIQTSWEIVRPGRTPGDNLKQALKKLQTSIGKRCLLVIDQFEEIETQCEKPKQKEIFWEELIKILTAADMKVDIILTLRSDFETTLRSQFESALSKSPKFQSKADTHPWVSARFPMPPMEREELEKVIVEPAAKSIVFFEEKKNSDDRTLVDQLTHEMAGMPGALSLLSVALESMYESFKTRYKNSNQSAKREITWEDYEILGEGGVPGAIRKKATTIYNELSSDEQRILRWVMMRMITRKGTQQIARKQVMHTELKYPNNQDNIHREKIISLLIRQRLLVSGEEYYEPAHDALVREWDYISAWLAGKKQPDSTTNLQQKGEKAHKELNTVQEEQSMPGFDWNWLPYLKNIFLTKGKTEKQEKKDIQPFNLDLLQELNAAVNSKLLNGSSQSDSNN